VAKIGKSPQKRFLGKSVAKIGESPQKVCISLYLCKLSLIFGDFFLKSPKKS
jgi:hypothetical protein